MSFEDIIRGYKVLNKKIIETKDKKLFYKISLYNILDDEFASCFVNKEVFEKCNIDKVHRFLCDFKIYNNNTNVKIKDVM